MKRVFISILGLMCLISFSKADFRELTPQKLDSAIKKGVKVIDIRRLDEWNSTGIIRSSNKLTFFDEVGKYDLNNWLNKFEKIVTKKEQSFVLVCRSGKRTGIVGNFLNEKVGYKNTYHLKGGIKSWLKEKRETVK